MKFLHWLRHGLLFRGFIHELWWVQTIDGRKLMEADKCPHCRKLFNIKPTGIELVFWKEP